MVDKMTETQINSQIEELNKQIAKLLHEFEVLNAILDSHRILQKQKESEFKNE